MSWARLDDRFHGHPKVLKAGNGAAGLYCRAISYCADYGTNGHIPTVWARWAGTTAECRKLVDVGLWERVVEGEMREVVGRRGSGGRRRDDVTVVMLADGYFIRDFLHYSMTRDEWEGIKRKRAEAGSKGGQGQTDD